MTSGKGIAGITAPQALAANHLLAGFSCGNTALDDWLHHRAAKAEGRSARAYVACIGNSVVAYYCLSASAVRLKDVPKKLTRNMPELVPVILIGRLAVDQNYQRFGLGKALLRDALSRALTATQTIGCRAVMVHSIDDQTVAFYEQYGFQAFPAGLRTLFLPIETIAAAIG